MKTVIHLLTPFVIAAAVCFAQNNSYQYKRMGNENDFQSRPEFGLALMGGGTDLDEAFRWLCNKGAGGDFLILRARGNDDYNQYVNGLCNANSVATLIIPNREAAQRPEVAEIIRKAEVVFIAGGDQANYTRNWKGTKVEEALNAGIAAGKPMGGTSAGLAVLGEYLYSAEGDKPDDADLASAQVLADPFIPRVALRRDFLHIELLKNSLTDTHFAKRDRMGRTLGFLARIVSDGWSSNPNAIAVDEKNAVLVAASGEARVVGSGKGAYFLSVHTVPEICQPESPLTFRDVLVYRALPGSQFNLKRWNGIGGSAYSLSVISGKIRSTQANGEAY